VVINVCLHLWGLRPQTPTRALPLDPLGDFSRPVLSPSETNFWLYAHVLKTWNCFCLARSSLYPRCIFCAGHVRYPATRCMYVKNISVASYHYVHVSFCDDGSVHSVLGDSMRRMCIHLYSNCGSCVPLECDCSADLYVVLTK